MESNIPANPAYGVYISQLVRYARTTLSEGFSLSFIMKTLDYLNFGTDMKRWVNTFYSNTESTVVHNGNRTNWFKPSKGVCQGCPFSSCLYILSAELLANKICQDSTVKGIRIFGNKIKLSQFADDTTLFNADLRSLEKALKIMQYFGRLAGLFFKGEENKGDLVRKMEE